MDIKVVARNELRRKRGQYKRATSCVSLESDVADEQQDKQQYGSDQQDEQRPGCQRHNQQNVVVAI